MLPLNAEPKTKNRMKTLKNMAYLYKLIFIGILLNVGIIGTTIAQCPDVVWSDEFEGNQVDTDKWEFQIGDGCSEGICGWGNNELQFYQAENATVSDGLLRITAKEQRVRAYRYTSARLRTLNKGDFKYGRFEARIKIPQGQGIWPAFWMMPTEEVYGGWPKSGEIDIMENVGHELKDVHGTIHYGDDWPNNQSKGVRFSLNEEQGIFADQFFTFAIEREEGEIRWYVDDVLYSTITADDLAPYNWPFDEKFHFILNVAVGGDWPGDPDGTTVFPQVMEVDYVRVYDGFFPSISGDRIVSNQENNVTYTVNNVSGGTSVNWSVPEGATIVNGNGTSTVTVDWGTTGGDVIASFSDGCGSKELKINVEVEPPFTYDFSFENFDDEGTADYIESDGTLTVVSNPDQSGINTSSLSGKYERDQDAQWDVIFYSTSAIQDASEYSSRNKKFYMDIYTSSAPVGTQILLQLEDSGQADAGNFPAGRHSRYQAFTTTQNSWERLEFDFVDQPDASTSDFNVDNIVVLFAPDSFTDDIYYFDNFDSYKIDDGTGDGDDETVPAAPGSLSATAVSSSQIDLSWTDNSTNEDGFRVERSMDGNSFSDIATLNANTTSYSDTDLNESTTYYYRVLAFNSSGDSDYSNTDSATTQADGDGGTPTHAYVSDITLDTQNAGQGRRNGTATVTILDNTGSAVSDATVSGTFSGDFNESASGVTGSDGTVTLVTTNSLRGGVSFEFCVNDVSHASLFYDSEANVVTCSDDEGANKVVDGLFADSPESFELKQNFPNPFNPTTQISYTIPEDSQVKLTVYNMLGEQVAVLVDSYQSVGTHQVTFDASNLSSGIYIYRLNAGSQFQSRKLMTIIK